MQQVTQLLDVGASNPIVARLSTGLFDLIAFASIEKDKKEALKESCFEMMQLLVAAEKSALPLLAEIKGIEAAIRENGVEVQKNGFTINTPGVLQLDNARITFKFLKQTLMRLATAAGRLLGKEYKEAHFHKMQRVAAEQLGPDHVVTLLLAEDQEWLKKLLDMRNEDEHAISGKP